MDTDEDRDTRGYAWTSQAGAALSNPSTSQLARDCEKPIAHLATQMALLRPENFLKNNGLHLACKAGMCCEKASVSALASVFSATDPAFAQRINPVFSIFLFDSFVPTHLIRRFSQTAPPSELPCGSLSLLVPKSRFALRANLWLLLIRAIPRRLTLRAASSSLPCDRPGARVRTPTPVLGCGSKNDFAVNDFAKL